ncbi:MAG: divalent-cation tolerance protein CutA [candidate division WOR-3 bacterium]
MHKLATPASITSLKGYLQLSTTTPTLDMARRIVTQCLRSRLAACAQVLGPIESTYWWRGKIRTSREWLCLIKTRRDCRAELVNLISSLHDYEVPEIVAVTLNPISDSYRHWLDQEINSSRH